MIRRLAPLLAIVIAACSWQGPSLLGHAGLDTKLRFYYSDRATENNFTCNLPEMSISRATIVEETAEQLIVDVGYYWRDSTFGRPSMPMGVGSCTGFSERTFTLAKRPDGSLAVTSMTGPQRSRG